MVGTLDISGNFWACLIYFVLKGFKIFDVFVFVSLCRTYMS